MSIEAFMKETGMSIQAELSPALEVVDGVNNSTGTLDIMGTMERTLQIGNQVRKVLNTTDSVLPTPAKFNLFKQ